ncbi:hypothetical protein [Catelliglobosispora koreensis]|uniref:hypothetical protein n=1 Tax=Catelliglobosispora koreensis TaxID=129052 RepID=UPI0003732A7A|nr:hypothetical protein [Catelliglobosispora koreensis]
MGTAFLCGCGHSWSLHDIEEYPGDGSDLCCVTDCDQIGCPGRERRQKPAAPAQAEAGSNG